MTDNAADSLEAWKDAVKKKYPQQAAKLKFKSQDQGKHISAEIDGEDRSYGVFDVAKNKGQVLGENILQSYLDSFESGLNKIESFEQLTEALQGSKVNCFIVSPKDIPGLKDDVFAIKNESPVVDFLVTLLGIPRDGTSYKIRTGFMAYDEKNKVLFFSKNKYDLPAYLGKRPK